MQFLEKLFFGRQLPEYSEQAMYPSTTYKKGKCTRKHCSELCETKKSEYDWEYWAFFLSEREASKTSLLKKIYNINDDLRFSIYAKLLGARDLKLNIKYNFEARKSDRKVADYILKYYRDKNSDCIVGGKQIEKISFNIYRNIIDVFFDRKEEKTSKNTISNAVVQTEDEKLELDNKQKEEIHEEIDISSSTDENLETSFSIYTSDNVDEELVVFIDYFLGMEYSVEDLAYRIIYVLLERMRLGDLFFLSIDKSSYLCRGMNEKLFQFLKQTNFKFLKIFIRKLIENEPCAFNKILDNSLCFSSTSFLEILNNMIRECEETILKLEKSNDIKNLENKSNEESSNNTNINAIDLEESEMPKISDVGKSQKSSSVGKKIDIEEDDNPSTTKISEAKSKIKNIKDHSSKKSNDDIEKLNIKISDILYDFTIQNTESKLNNYRKKLKQQPINILQVEPIFENQEEEYFDFLIVQNQTVKAQKNIKHELVDRIKKLHTANEALKAQNENLKENLEKATKEIEDLHKGTIVELQNEISKLKKNTNTDKK